MNNTITIEDMLDTMSAAIGAQYGRESVEHYVFSAMMESFKLFVAKQADYGPTNIGVTGATGIIVRLADKMSRLINLFNSGKDPKNESVRDTFQDMLNYAAMAMVDLDGNWPRFTPEEAWALDDLGVVLHVEEE